MRKACLTSILFACVTLICSSFVIAFADGAESDLNTAILDILKNLDLETLDKYLQLLDENQLQVFGSTNIISHLSNIISGKNVLSYDNIFSFILSLIGLNIKDFFSNVVLIVVISILLNIVTSLKGKFASASIENITSFFGTCMVGIILLIPILSLLNSVREYIQTLTGLSNTLFPILLTLMTSIGATASVGVYQPSVIILSSFVMNIMSSIILPMFIVSLVFAIVSSFSTTIKLNNTAEFFSSVSKWLVGTIFFLMISILSIQGVTASVFDGISIRSAKFALAKYVPIIGGYLSEGFNMIMAGSVLVKNSLGLSAIIICLLLFLPLLIKLIIFKLSLSLISAIVEPIGQKQIGLLVTNVNKCISMLIMVLIAVSFLFFIFVILIVCTGNLAL